MPVAICSSFASIGGHSALSDFFLLLTYTRLFSNAGMSENSDDFQSPDYNSFCPHLWIDDTDLFPCGQILQLCSLSQSVP